MKNDQWGLEDFKRVFNNITEEESGWGQVLVAFHFGWAVLKGLMREMAIELCYKFLRYIAQVIKNKVAGWVSQLGGWEAAPSQAPAPALALPLPSVSWSQAFQVIAVVALAAIAIRGILKN